MSPSLDLDDYAFDLPPDRIAQAPLARRDQSRLMHLDRKSGIVVGDLGIGDLPGRLRSGDLLVVNTTRVLNARLHGRKTTGGRAEALLLGPESPAGSGHFRVLLKIGGRLKTGLTLDFGLMEEALPAEVIAVHEGGEVTLAFTPGSDPLSLGEPPLPPYIRRDPDRRSEALLELDRERYQTIYARVPGAIAAPTAGLHMTSELLANLKDAGISSAEVVLHVGKGTFRPLRPEDLARDRLHAERYQLPAATVEAVAETRARGGRIIAVGTTTTRVLESCATPDSELKAGSGETEIFLRPGSSFRIVDGLITNFHLPRSSLLLLVAAFAGREAVLEAYSQAIALEYRFYSYGDAMLIL